MHKMAANQLVMILPNLLNIILSYSAMTVTVHSLELILIDRQVLIQAHALAMDMVDDHIHVFLGMNVNLLSRCIIFKTQLVEALALMCVALLIKSKVGWSLPNPPVGLS